MTKRLKEKLEYILNEGGFCYGEKTALAKRHKTTVYMIDKWYNQLVAEREAERKLHHDVNQAIAEGHNNQTEGWKQEIIKKFHISPTYFIERYASYLSGTVYADTAESTIYDTMFANCLPMTEWPNIELPGAERWKQIKAEARKGL